MYFTKIMLSSTFWSVGAGEYELLIFHTTSRGSSLEVSLAPELEIKATENKKLTDESFNQFFIYFILILRTKK